MIGNKLVNEYYNNMTLDQGMCQLMDFVRNEDERVLKELEWDDYNFDSCTEKEIGYLTILTTGLVYTYLKNKINIPGWMLDDKLRFEHPYYHDERLSDSEQIELYLSCTSICRHKNVYIEESALCRM